MELRSKKQVKNDADFSVGLSIAHKCSSRNEHKDKKQNISIYDDKDLSFRVIDGGSGDGNEVSIGTNNKGKSFGCKVAYGGTLVQLVKSGNKVNSQVGGGLKEAIYSFSIKSRNMLLRHLFSMDRTLLDDKEVLFITLTYDENTEENKWIQGKEYKRHLKNITQAIQRKYGGFGFWKWELQKRLVGHFHLVWFKTEYISHYWLSHRWNEIIGGSENNLQAGTQVQRAKSWKGVQLYGSKVMGYVAKDETTYAQREHMAKINIGRSWGISNRSMFSQFVRMLYMELSESMYIGLNRIYRNLQKSWKTKIGNYKGWKSMQTWMRSWGRISNLTLNVFMENEVIQTVLKWVQKEFGSTKETSFQKMKRESKHRSNKLEMWRLSNGYGIYEGIEK